MFGSEHRQTLEARQTLAQILDSSGRSEEAEPIFASLLESREREFAAESPQVGGAMCMLGGCRLRLGKVAEAEPLVSEGYRRLQASRPDSHPAVRDAAADLERLRAMRSR